MYWSLVSMWLTNFSLIEQRKVISSLLSKTSVTWILKIFVGHGKIMLTRNDLLQIGTSKILIGSLLSGSDGTLSIFVL